MPEITQESASAEYAAETGFFVFMVTNPCFSKHLFYNEARGFCWVEVPAESSSNEVTR